MKSKTILTALIGLLALNALVFQACKKDEINKAPGCEIVNPSNGDIHKLGEIVTISVNASDSDGNIKEVLFLIDGVSKGSANSSPYKYDWNTAGESTGNHTLTATSVDNNGASTSDEIIIELIEEGVTDFSATPSNGDAPLTVSFSDQSTNNPTSWQWDFGDGNTSSEQNPSHTYNNTGAFSVALTVTNAFGTFTETKDGFIVVSIPVANFSCNATGGTASLTVDFKDESINNPTSWLWDFGDGGNSTEQNPTYTYHVMGMYDVSLTATNEYGTDTETKTNFITVNGGDPVSVIDARDGQTYKIVTIGDYTWFAENLNYETADSWFYEDNPAMGDIYGRLYEWDAAITACPAGWHLSTDEEWKILEGIVDSEFGVGDPEWDRLHEYVGKDAGFALKSVSGWNTFNGTDAVGFNGFPGGLRFTDGSYGYLGVGGYFWTGTESSDNSAYTHGLSNTSKKIAHKTWLKGYGYSVRCIKD